MADQEEKPKRHFTFTEFSANDVDSPTGEQIRESLQRKTEELRNDIQIRTQSFNDYKAKTSEEQTDLADQKTELAKDPQKYYDMMLKRRDNELAELDAAYPDKTITEYSAKVAVINAKYAMALDKDTLDKNPSVYTNNNFDRLEKNVEQANKRLDTETTRFNGEVNRLNTQIKGSERQIGILDKDPELYAKLHEIKKFSENDERVAGVGLDQNSKGEPCLAVVMKEAGIPYGFMISDGRITFNQDSIDKMTVDTMRSILDYLERRGITGIELPDDIDKKLAESYEQAEAANRQELENEQNTPTGEPGDYPLPEGEQLPEDFGNRDRSQDEDRGITTISGPDQIDYKKAKKNIDDWVFGDGGLNKSNGWDAFKKTTTDGYDVWTIYDQGNFKNEELDGKTDKDGYMKVKYAFKIYAKTVKDANGNDKLELSYAMPNKKKISDGYAKGIMRMMKKSGITHANFPKGLPEEDEGTFRIACASNGIVPKFKNLSASKIKKMLDEAESKLSDKELLDYKLRLAEWMEQCANEDNMKSGKEFSEHKNATLINNLKGEYKYTPFRDMYEKGGGMRETLEQIIRDNEDNKGGWKIDPNTSKEVLVDGKKVEKTSGAIKIAAAADAVKDVFELYKQHSDQSFGEMLNDPWLSDKIRNDFMKNMGDAGAAFDPNKKVRDLKPKEMNALFLAVAKSNETKIENDLLDELKANAKTSGRPESDATITGRIVGKANNHLREVNNLLEDNGVKKIYCPSLGTPRHDFDPMREKHNIKPRSNQNFNNNNGRDYDD